MTNDRKKSAQQQPQRNTDAPDVDVKVLGAERSVVLKERAQPLCPQALPGAQVEDLMHADGDAAA